MKAYTKEDLLDFLIAHGRAMNEIQRAQIRIMEEYIAELGGLTTKKKRPHFLARVINFLKFKSLTS